MINKTIKRIIFIKENKSILEWSGNRFEAEDSLYGIKCCSADKEQCIHFVKGALLHAIACGYPDGTKVPDKITIEFIVKEI